MKKLFMLFLLFIGCASTMDLSNPEKVVIKYVEANIDADIRIMAYLETGEKDALDSTFGVLSNRIAERIWQNRKLDRNDYSWRNFKKRQDGAKIIVNFTMIIPDDKKILKLAEEYLGEVYVNGKLELRKPIKPNLSSEEAFEMAKKDPSYAPLEVEVAVTLKKVSENWIVLPSESKSFMRIFYPFDMKYQEK
jgi:hypothetical protein